MIGIRETKPRLRSDKIGISLGLSFNSVDRDVKLSIAEDITLWCVCICSYMYICVCLCICMFVYVYICICVSMCVVCI